LITTRSSDGKRGAWSFGASLGAFETSQAQLSTPDLRLGPYSGSLSLHAFDTAGYTLNTDERSLELEQSSSLSLGQEDLNLKAGYLERKGGIPLVKSIAANGTGDVDADDREERQAFDLSLVDESRLGAWDFDPGLDYSFVRARRLNPFDDDAQAGLSTDNTDTGLHWGLRLPLRRRWEGLLLNLDTAASQESLESGLSGWHGRDQGSFNLRTRTKAYPWLSVDLSGGVDSVTGFPVEFLPSGALNFEPVPGRRLSLSAGMGRRVPQLDQLYRAPLAFTALADPAFGAGEKGDPDLLPERSLKTQAALDLRGRDFSLNLAGFYDSLTDLIDYQLDPADNYWTYGNLGQARVYGGEGSLSAHLGNFSPFANYTYVDSRSQTGDLILGRLRQKISYGCGWQVLDRLELHAEHQYFEHNGPTSPYWWLNAGISASLTGGGKVFINGSNILDQVSDLMPGLPLRGRYFEVGTKFEF
jgi:outer membrane receptor protein involved in Fe transport